MNKLNFTHIFMYMYMYIHIYLWDFFNSLELVNLNTHPNTDFRNRSWVVFESSPLVGKLGTHWPGARRRLNDVDRGVCSSLRSVTMFMESLRGGVPRGSATQDSLGNLGQPWGRIGSIGES